MELGPRCLWSCRHSLTSLNFTCGPTDIVGGVRSDRLFSTFASFGHAARSAGTGNGHVSCFLGAEKRCRGPQALALSCFLAVFPVSYPRWDLFLLDCTPTLFTA